MTAPLPPRCLSVAGSDPTGGAGLQADLRAFAYLGCYGMAAPSALTVQTTEALTEVVPVEARLLRAQLDAALGDVGADAVKVGMLADAAGVQAVGEALRAHGPRAVVVDPVLSASVGGALAGPDGAAALRHWLIPLATVLTPNLPELSQLTGAPVAGEGEAIAAAEALRALGARWVLVKGGHGADPARVVDLLVGPGGVQRFEGPRLSTPSTHGTGCVLSSLLAAGLAQGLAVPAAVAQARGLLREALGAAVPLGAGAGPCLVWPLKGVGSTLETV